MQKSHPWPQPKKLKLPIASTWITDLERSYCDDVLESNWIGSNGKYNELSEKKLTQILGQESLTVTNGSVAIILALRALGINPDDEVLVPDLTYAATASSVIHVGATPIFCDIEVDSWGISIDSMRRKLSTRTRAIIVVHLYGKPANIGEILDFAHAHKLKVIEDCAEAFDASVGNQKVGTFGDISTFSFFANKLITSGEGGAVSSRNPSLIENMRVLRGQGMDPDRRYFFQQAGYNFRMSNLHAAILYGQLERLEEIKNQREIIEIEYRHSLKELIPNKIQLSHFHRSPWLFTTLLEFQNVNQKWELASLLAKNGIETRPVFYPLSSMPAFEKYPSDENMVSKEVSENGMSFPTGKHVRVEDVRKICLLVSDFLKG